ncbi:MAG: carboxypeptidase-like regulatory domain-containing protein, partial [Chitinophagaceae bacterium]|nr:carboxypeptidase-like regulatory domain-containing protein [Chitinophagaceae bacterium]
MKKIVASFLSIIIASACFAQVSITGSVQGKNENLQGVSIKVLPSKKATITNAQGVFELKNIPSGKIIIQFSYTGFELKDTVVEASNNAAIVLNISLEESKKELDEVVVVSSSRTNSRIEDLPTKVEVLGAEEVHEENQIKPGNIASLLGDIAGIQIQQTNAATGSADLRIQGLQGKYTQILRDGMPLFGGFSGS